MSKSLEMTVKSSFIVALVLFTAVLQMQNAVFFSAYDLTHKSPSWDNNTFTGPKKEENEVFRCFQWRFSSFTCKGCRENKNFDAVWWIKNEKRKSKASIAGNGEKQNWNEWNSNRKMRCSNKGTASNAMNKSMNKYFISCFGLFLILFLHLSGALCISANFIIRKYIKEHENVFCSKAKKFNEFEFMI